MSLLLTLVLVVQWGLTLLKMDDDLNEFAQWSEEEILNELRYLLAEDFIKLVERDGEYYVVINEDAEDL